MKYCKKCWTPNTRPRITFNQEGVCDACQWAKEKETVDWQERLDYFKKLCDRYRGNGKDHDCIVPWSGGKDSIYVAYKMKELGMNPLLMTIIPHLETDIGRWNRENLCPEFEHYEIRLNANKYRDLAKKYFIEDGRPKHPWECAISAVVISQAAKLNIPFVIYGEDGGQEYGGSSQKKDEWKKPVSREHLMKFYYQNKLDWNLPKFDFNLFFTQWSKFENWQPTKHGDFAEAKGMKTEPERSIATFTSTNQLSDKLQDLHTYLMFLKFGFGRCTSDVGIAIREGWMGRETGLLHIEEYDHEFSDEYLVDYLKYFKMTRPEFAAVLKKFATERPRFTVKSLLVKTDDIHYVLDGKMKQIRRDCL